MATLHTSISICYNTTGNPGIIVQLVQFNYYSAVRFINSVSHCLTIFQRCQFWKSFGNCCVCFAVGIESVSNWQLLLANFPPPLGFCFRSRYFSRAFKDERSRRITNTTEITQHKTPRHSLAQLDQFNSIHYKLSYFIN